jgi:hypothetical protein
MLAEAQRVEAIPAKRTAPPQTDYLEHDEIRLSLRICPDRERFRFEIGLSPWSSTTPARGLRKSLT